MLRRIIPRASLEGLPADLRLEIFKHLLLENLPVCISTFDDETGPVKAKEKLLNGCADSQSLVFVYRGIHEESTELLFQNVDVTFDILINQCSKDLRLPGLYGLGFTWFSNLVRETAPRRAAEAKAAALADYLHNVHTVNPVVLEQISQE
ncbi:hypothetical protein Vi05172_g5577 [Venturia inaequalis]|nr:hypothetical protein Vi05172_g5577 [Venturia inaequalis]